MWGVGGEIYGDICSSSTFFIWFLMVISDNLNLTWSCSVEYSEDIEVAELLGVCWLEIKGEIRTIDLSPRTVYEVVFVVKMLYMWNYSVTLTLILPHSKKVTHDENLREKPIGEWFEIQVGEFKMTPENVGEISFQLGEFSSDWKCGAVLKCAIIRPKNY